MERPAKRPRLLTPLDSVYAGFGNQHAYLENPDNELKDYEEPEEEDDEPIYDPDQELQRKRARVDFKLKSTFEAIFEKYGRDFEGIGDEIDMRTGEVIVNNGHLLEMRHEMDAGDSGHTRGRQRSWSEEDNETSGSEEEDDMENEDDDNNDDQDESDDDNFVEDYTEDYDHEDALSDGDMMEEDDLILRGFAQASQQFKQRPPSQDPGPSRDRSAAYAEPRHPVVSRRSLQGSVIPSRSEILAQFGPQLGPEIVKYVCQREILEDSNIEPAWRAPGIVPTASSPPNRRPFINSMVRQPSPEPERSPSPDNAPSIWAVQTSKSKRKRFSREEDNLLLDFIAGARRQGLKLSSHLTWRQLEAMNPRHDWIAWKSRYTRKFTYLYPGEFESDLSTSETSATTDQLADSQVGLRSSISQSLLPRPSQTLNSQRPARVRKPAQRDGIVSWSDAVTTIASVDPVGNAGLLDDARRTTGLAFSFGHPVSSSSRRLGRHSEHDNISKQPMSRYSHHRNISGLEIGAGSLRGVENDLALNDLASHDERSSKAPCPHADCRPYPNTMYRLELRNDEEVSPMYSHLVGAHRIAPFSCGELNCDRKGPRGYLLQRDLVRHVKEAHPYADPSLRRFRVDPDLLDYGNTIDWPQRSMENHRPIKSYQLPRDFDLATQQRPFSSYGPSSSRRFSLGSDQNSDRALTPRAGARTVSGSAPSMDAHPFSVTVKDMPFIDSRQKSSDSDLKVLDKNPFLDTRPSKPQEASHLRSASSKKLICRLQGTSQKSLHRVTEPKIPCTWPGCCKMISTHSGNMQAHLKVHERRSRSLAATKEAIQLAKPPLAVTIPNSQSSANETQSSAAPALSMDSVSLSAPQTLMPPGSTFEGFVDRSYDFSDEEEGIRPVIRKQAPKPALPGQAPPVPQSFFPTPKIKSPHSPVSASRLLQLQPKAPSPKTHNPFATPAFKAKPRKSLLRDVLDSDDFDELSLGEEGFVLLSARTKPGGLPNSALNHPVKLEEFNHKTSLITSSKKRKFSSLEFDDEIDELAEDSPSISTPHQLVPISSSKPPKKVVEDPVLPSMRQINVPKSRNRHSDPVEATKPGSSLRIELISFQTPTKHQQLPVKTTTPLTDLVKHGQSKRSEPNVSNEEIPSTSEPGSSPNSRHARTRRQQEAPRASSLPAALVTPRKKTWAGRTVKREDEESVVTPGGTLRRCGQDGFACHRVFCFRCRAEDGKIS